MSGIQARTALLVLTPITLLLCAGVALAQVSANHDLSWHVIAGGGGRMESAGHTLFGTAGQPLAGSMSGSGYTLNGGFWVSGATRVVSGTRYVAPDGADSGDCSTIANRCRTIQYAIDVAASNDEIRVAGGTFTGTGGTVAAIAKTLTITGGYALDFGSHDPGTYQTVLDARWGGSVVSVTNAVSVSLYHLTLIHGDGTGNQAGMGAGGGIFNYNTNLLVAHSVITDNLGSHSGRGWGGGLYSYSQDASHMTTLMKNQIVSNTAGTDPSNTGSGGGVYILGGKASLVGNQIVDNLGHGANQCWGGGVYLESLTWGEVLTNVIRGNVGSRTTNGYGSGLYVSGGKVRVAGNYVEGNWSSSGNGGGLESVWSDIEITGNRIISNTSSSGSGMFISSLTPVAMVNNLIVRNDSGFRGGGIYLVHNIPDPTPAILVNNTIADNGPDGIATWGYVVLTMTNNLLTGNPVGILASHPVSLTFAADTNLFYNTSDPLTGTNGILEDPLLTVDYHLGVSSPAIDAGLTIPWLTTDLDGNPRPQGSGYDIGAYEGTITNTAPTAAFTVSPGSGYTTTVFAFDASGCSDAQDLTSALQVRWDWENDGSYNTAWCTTKTVTHAYTAVGTYTVRLEVRDTGGLTDTTSHQVTVRGGTIDYWIFLPLVLR